eukprot:g1429.t1
MSSTSSSELPGLRLQIQALVEQRRADEIKERDGEKAAMMEKIKELEKQRAMDAVKAELRAEQSRRDETMNMQRQLANMAMQRKLDQVVLSVALTKSELLRSMKERELQHQLEQERVARKGLEERVAMQQQIRELTQRLDASFEQTGPSFFPTRMGHKQVVAVSEAEGRLAQIATKKAALAQQMRQLEAEQQHEAEQLEAEEQMVVTEAELAQQKVLEAEVKTLKGEGGAVKMVATQPAEVLHEDTVAEAETKKDEQRQRKSQAIQPQGPVKKSGAKTPKPTPLPKQRPSPATKETVKREKRTVKLPPDESDARHGAYDFYAEQIAAPDDLQHLTDHHESMAFRRRGYEVGAPFWFDFIRTLSHFDLIQSDELQQQQEKQQLATLPEELRKFDLDKLRDRPVQAEILALLLLQKDHDRFTSSVLVHGMGGTGKTVTVVAVLQEGEVRAHFSDIYWLAVGADSVGEKIRQLQAMLHEKLTGKSTKSEEKDESEWLVALAEALAEKPRALVVLDDPWVPEQVRFLNPVEGSSTNHRLLITTRIRDLVPRATRVELSLMDEDEAVALLLDLANIEEAHYLKHQGSRWPPQAAYELVSECGLLPITLTIAAQVVRSWGQGWETEVLPVLREQQESSQSGTSTVEERVIGAGLKALGKNNDGLAVKELFYMFAVTAEDFVHPMPVIELLWRSCCASEVEKQERSLANRLRVRQRTQLLVDHSLLLGSSTEGVHLHDIVLQYLRKRLPANQLRAEHQKVVEGMVAAAAERMKTTGAGLQEMGMTHTPCAGEEIDWYYDHMKIERDHTVPLLRQARDQAVGARREFRESFKNIQMIIASMFAVCHGSEKNAK